MKYDALSRGLLCCVCAGILATTALLGGCGAQTAEETAPTEPADSSLQVRPPVSDSPSPVENTAPSPKPTPIADPSPTPTPDPTPTPLPQGLAALYSGRAEVPVMPEIMADTNLSHRGKILKIREWYYATEDANAGLESCVYDDSYTGFWKDGKLVKVDVREILDPIAPPAKYTGVSYHYYYHDDMPYFAYIIDHDKSNSELRLYFWNGELIRWIANDGVRHDGTHGIYAQYCEGAWEISQILQTLLQ